MKILGYEIIVRAAHNVWQTSNENARISDIAQSTDTLAVFLLFFQSETREIAAKYAMQRECMCGKWKPNRHIWQREDVRLLAKKYYYYKRVRREHPNVGYRTRFAIWIWQCFCLCAETQIRRCERLLPHTTLAWSRTTKRRRRSTKKTREI